MSGIDHIFICRNWHLFNDMFPFFNLLDRKEKYFFTDVSHTKFRGYRRIDSLGKVRSKSKKAIVYISCPKDFLRYAVNGSFGHYKDIKVVRMFHGIVGPWAKIIDSKPDFIDLVIAASRLDGEVWKRYTNYHVEVVGWPKGESFYSLNFQEKTDTHGIIVASNWAREKGDLTICDALGELKELDITFMLHPLLEGHQNSHRGMDRHYVYRQLNKLKYSHIDTVRCEHGVLQHMKGKSCLLGVISSSSLEWLLFDRPVIFLKRHNHLDFGPLLDYEKGVLHQIIDSIEGEDIYANRRKELRERLMSHFDGMTGERFNGVIGELEKRLTVDRHLIKTPDIFQGTIPAAYPI